MLGHLVGMSKPTKVNTLLAGLSLAGVRRNETKRCSARSASVLADVLLALDHAGCDDVPSEIEHEVTIYMAERRVRVTEHGVEWVPPRAAGEK